MSEETVVIDKVGAEDEVQISIVGGNEKRTDYIMKIGSNNVEVTRQLFDDQFNYDQYKCVAPIYDFDALLYFFDNNTWHSRCCRLKAACTVSLGYIFKLKDGKQEDKTEYDELIEFFDNCNPTETLSEILEKFMIDYESIGNGYLEIIRNVSGKIVGVYHIPAITMRVRRDRDGYVQMRDTRYVFFKNFGNKEVYDIEGNKGPTTIDRRATEVIHFFQYSPRTTYYGVPEWLSSMAAMFGTEKAEDFNIQFFENNAVPQFAIIVKKAKLGDPVKEVIANYFRNEIKGKHHKTLVIEVPGEGELELEKLATDTKDSSFRFYRLDNRDEVIASHGVPPRMVGVIAAGALGGKGDSEGQEKAFITQIILPRQRALNHRFNKLVIGNGLGAKSYKFELEALNPSNPLQDAEMYDKYIKIGLLTVNEGRDALRKPRYDKKEIPGADEPFIFTSSGPILLSKLSEYMDNALMPEQPSPPGLPGGSGTSSNKKNVTRSVSKGIISDIVKIQEALRDELNRIEKAVEQSGHFNTVDVESNTSG